MKMRDSNEFKKWQKDLILLTEQYSIASTCNKNEPVDVFTQILQAADSLPAAIEKMLDTKTSESMQCFLKTSADSLLELCNLIKISLNLNLITIDEYHSLLSSLSEISTIIEKFLTIINCHQENTGEKLEPKSEGFAFWALN